MLLNIAVFMWYGAVAPWASFRANDVIPVYRLVFLGVLILLFRRLPMVLAFRHQLKEIDDWQQAVFVGFFGPIGVSAVFYLYISIDFLNQVLVEGEVRQDAARLQDVMRVVIWFLAISSIVVHGLSVPLGKLGYHMPRQLSQALSTEREEPAPLDLRRLQDPAAYLRRRRKQNRDRSEPPTPMAFVLGQQSQNRLDEPERPVRIINTPLEGSGVQTPRASNEMEARTDGNPAHLGHLMKLDSGAVNAERTNIQNDGRIQIGGRSPGQPNEMAQKDE